MFIYKWPADKENDTGIVSQLSYCDVSGEHPTPCHATTGGLWGLWDLQGAGWVGSTQEGLWDPQNHR